MVAAHLIGLEIGSTSVRAADVCRGKDGPVVSAFGHVPLPDGAVRAGAVQDGQAVTAAVKQLWASHRFHGRRVVLGLANPQVVVRETAVLNLPDRELRRSLPFQVQDALPMPVQRCVLDFHPVQRSAGAETVRGLLIAAPKDAVLAAVHAVERAGLHVARVDLAAFALIRAASGVDGQVEAMVDIGARVTTVVVHSDGRPVIVRTVPRGGAEITETIADRLGGGLADAESVKRRIGMRAELDLETAELIRDAGRPVVSEIRGSLAYLNAADPQARVTRIVLSGGGSLLPGFADALAGQFDIDVRPADPVVRVRDRRGGPPGDPDVFRATAAVPIGLTLGAA
jgi:type IV pilus assembly protein PilM